MSPPKRITLTRLVATALCVLALSVYITFAPTSINAASCTCGGGLSGKCDGGQRCVCMSQNGVCTGCEWSDDRTCPCQGGEGFCIEDPSQN